MDVPHFEPDELETANRIRQHKERRARRRWMRRVDRYWLLHWLDQTRRDFCGPDEGFPWHWYEIADPKIIKARLRAYYRSIRAWQRIHIHAKRQVNKRLRRSPFETRRPPLNE